MGDMTRRTWEQVVRGLKRFRKLRSVSFWGIGEPLLNPGLPDMILELSRLGVFSELTTNGHLLTRETGARLLDSGLASLTVSLDGGTEQAYREVRDGAGLARPLENVRIFNELRSLGRGRHVRLGVQFVLMKQNLNQVGKVLELAEELAADFVLVSNLLPHHRDQAGRILYWLAGEQAQRIPQGPWRDALVLPAMDPRALEAVRAQAAGFPERRIIGPQALGDASGGWCPFVGQGGTSISWKGEVSPCVPLLHTHACFVLGREKTMKRHSFGNVNETSLESIWRSEEYRAFRDRVRRFEFSPCATCGGCHLSQDNQEDCTGSGGPRCGDCLWARGLLIC